MCISSKTIQCLFFFLGIHIEVFYTTKQHKHNNLADKAIYKHMHCSQNQQWRALSQEQRGITLQHAAKRKIIRKKATWWKEYK